MKKKLIVIQTVAPDYRSGFYKNIQTVLKDSFELYAGDYYFESSVKTNDSIPQKKLKNIYLFNRKILFQTGIWHLLFKDFILVLEMNPRIVSNWLFLVVRRLAGRETVLWGHAWPRKGRAAKSDRLRHLMRVLSDRIIVYTKKQKEELEEVMPSKEILAASNAVINSSEMINSYNIGALNLIYVGRLTELKKPLFLVKAFHQGIEVFPKEMKLIIVGEGNEKSKILDFIEEKGITDRVQLMGHVNDYKTLKKLYSNSFFSVSPGYIGLSVTQSFGFGVPMIISKNENHSPEIEAVKEKENALFFDTDNKEDFVLKLKEAYEDRLFWIEQRDHIVQLCQKNYSIDAMADVFINLLKTV